MLKVRDAARYRCYVLSVFPLNVKSTGSSLLTRTLQLALLVILINVGIFSYLFTVNETTDTAVCTNMSSRPKRNLTSSPGCASSLPEEDWNEDQPNRQKHSIKRVRKAVERDEPSAVNTAAPPSKGTDTSGGLY